MIVSDTVKILGDVKLTPSIKGLLDRLMAGTVLTPSVAYILDTSRDFALYVNDDRAIPFIGDGLKYVQRVALWLLRNKADKVKVVGLTGELMKEGLYVHGDVSCSDAISLLAAPFKNNVMLVQGDGQFGSRVEPVDGIGAPRYVSVKRSKAAQAFLYCDADIVPLGDNYDGSNQRPEHFLPLIPTVLLNGIAGIGVGYSTSILPRRFSDVVAATIAALKGQKIPVLVPHYERYHVGVKPTGLPNQWLLSGKAKVIDTSTVEITELPPGVSLENFRKDLIEMEDSDKIVKFVDRSTDGIKIEVTFKRGSLKGEPATTALVNGKKSKVPAVPAWTDAKAIEFFKLAEKTTERIVVRDWTGKKIVQYPDAETVVKDFVSWRLEWYTTRFEKLLADTSSDLVYWRILEAMFKAGFTKKLGTFVNRAAVEADVVAIASKAKIACKDHHIDRAVSLPTYRWTKDFEGEIKAKIADLTALIADYRATLASPDRLKAIYLGELEALKKMKFD